MERTLIVLRGERNSGKTTTIRLAHDLLERGACVVERGAGNGKEVRRAILEVDGVRVGIYSRGDVAKYLKEALEFLVKKDCVVIVCAARWGPRRSSVTVDVVKRVAKLGPGYTVVLIDKEKDPESDQEKANEIIREVRKAIERAKLLEA